MEHITFHFNICCWVCPSYAFYLPINSCLLAFFRAFPFPLLFLCLKFILNFNIYINGRTFFCQKYFWKKIPENFPSLSWQTIPSQVSNNFLETSSRTAWNTGVSSNQIQKKESLLIHWTKTGLIWCQLWQCCQYVVT